MLQECAFPEGLVNNIMVEDKNQFWAQSILLFFCSSSTESRTAPLRSRTNKFKYLLREKDEVEEEADRSCSHSSLGS